MIDIIGIVVLAIIIGFIGYFIKTYNNLVAIRNNVKESWANIKVILKQRHDELSKLIDACKQYMGYENHTLEELTKARTSATQALDTNNTSAIAKAESTIQGSMKKLFAVAENYPDLKTNDAFNNLEKRVSALENSIADRRELYNDSVNINNTQIESFPDNIVANLFGFKHSELLKFNDDETSDISLDSAFGEGAANT